MQRFLKENIFSFVWSSSLFYHHLLRAHLISWYKVWFGYTTNVNKHTEFNWEHAKDYSKHLPYSFDFEVNMLSLI